MKNKKNLLGFDLETLINESIADLFESSFTDKTEKELGELLSQQKMGDALNKHRARFSKKKRGREDAGDEGGELETKQVKVKHEKIPDIDFNSIKTKIDNIRAGKSLKDPETKEALKSYIQKLNGPERIALFAFLSGLEKILGKAAKDVKTPHSEPYNIDMEQEAEQEKKNMPRGSKNPSKSKKSENPIIVGERADVRAIKAKLWKK
tara:strand:- start:8869 stop:9489 length:621 start_codon:yes stop_codon:yes gene_type:complete